MIEQFLRRSDLRRLLGVSDPTLSSYLTARKIRAHRFGGVDEGLFHPSVLAELRAEALARRPPRHYRTRTRYDPATGTVVGYDVLESAGGACWGPFTRNHAAYLAWKWNRPGAVGKASREERARA